VSVSDLLEKEVLGLRKKRLTEFGSSTTMVTAGQVIKVLMAVHRRLSS